MKNEEARVKLASGDAILVDVRREEEWAEGHVPGSISLPDGEGELPDLDGEKTLLVIDSDGGRAAELTERLGGEGREAEPIDGGMKAWIGDDLPLQPSLDADTPLDEPPDEPLEDRIPTG